MKNKFDYLLVLSPPQKLKQLVTAEKKITKKIIGKFDSVDSIAHLTMNDFQYENDYQIEPLFPSLRKKVLTLPPLILRTNGYSHFDNKVIYINFIIEHFEKEWFNQMGDHVKKAEIVPHITIAKGLSDEQFDKVWPIFKDKKCSESFLVECLTILRRNSFGPENYYAEFTRLKFKNNRLMVPFHYKNRKRRSSSRGNISGIQTSLF